MSTFQLEIFYDESNLNAIENGLDSSLYTGKRSYNPSGQIWKKPEIR